MIFRLNKIHSTLDNIICFKVIKNKPEVSIRTTYKNCTYKLQDRFDESIR